jgi:hypothetical protein
VTRHRSPSLLAAVVAALIAAGCSSDGGTTTAPTRPNGPTTTNAALGGNLPPKDVADLAPLYADQLAAIGMKLTPRGGLIDTSGGGYEHSNAGSHLALYVEPTGPRTNAEYIAGIRDVGAIFADDIFARWPGLKSFDVCQEPPTALDASPEPVAVTQIVLTREQAAAIDWKTVTVAQLVAGARASSPMLQLTVSSLISGDPDYQALAADGE